MAKRAREEQKLASPRNARGLPNAAAHRDRWRLRTVVSGVTIALASSCVLPSHRLPDATGGKSSTGNRAGTAGRGTGGISSASAGVSDGGRDNGATAGASLLAGAATVEGSAGTADTSGSSSYVGGNAGTAGVTSTSAGAPATGGIPSTGLPFVPASASAKSCKNLGSICQGESCCTSIEMPGGTYPMGRSEAGTDAYVTGLTAETPEHPATVASFALDKYEVTVGRFRNFVADYNSWHATAPVNPTDNAGAHPIAANTGWGRSWTAAAADLPADASALMTELNCNSSYQTWADSAGTVAAEAYPVNCVTWYQAFAFCIWDGGRLPTEAEWEYAAAGGAQNRSYPWGNETPQPTRANFSGPDGSPTIVVGSKLLTGGVGYFGHADLAGSLWEWAFDWYDGTYYGTGGVSVPCNNCANSASATYRLLRGGSWLDSAAYLRAAYRSIITPASRGYYIGFRCARTR